MTAAEQAALLRATAEAPRNHVLYSMALGTGLRLARHKRHSAVTAVYRATGNLFLAQRFAR